MAKDYKIDKDIELIDRRILNITLDGNADSNAIANLLRAKAQLITATLAVFSTDIDLQLEKFKGIVDSILEKELKD